MNRLLALALLILPLISAAVTARAEDDPQPPPNESLEWLLIARPAIAIEDVTNTAAARNQKTNNLDLTIQTQLKETLKGQPPQQASFVRRWQELKPGQDGGIRPDNGTEYLLFFDASGKVTNAINLKFPSRKLGVGVEPTDVAVSSDFSILKSGEAIKDAVHRRLAQISASTVALTPKKVEVPIDSAAWAVFYNGTTSYLLIPDGLPVKDEDPPITRTVQFFGPALIKECYTLPKKAFEIKSGLGRQPHTLSMSCSTFPNSQPEPQKLTVTFKVQGAPHPADYDFQWGTNPDTMPVQKAFFIDQLGCEVMSRMLRSRVSHDPSPLVAPDGVTDQAPPLQATWTVDCVPSEVWGFALAFELHVRYAAKDVPSNTLVPPPPVPPAPAAQ